MSGNRLVNCEGVVSTQALKLRQVERSGKVDTRWTDDHLYGTLELCPNSILRFLNGVKYVVNSHCRIN